ncbi:DNA primase [Mycolicibacterium sp. P9-64]|uniref:bifunctional DNA primase/polymerase n=1 Tax=Mycolicibacterium sp. P9-64 TaxID=2024612 RepID=UPI0011EDC8A1|nr:bifunctional DNA primase/polymerase [Mycolicibacterium sp. P9-64]KAA0086700.1 DNA primase [Mycolicibacterium sp. P9-64]
MTTANDLIAEALAIRMLRGAVREATDIGTNAVEYALHGWPVFPLRGKVPAISSRAGGRGVLDATCDILTVVRWWAGHHAGANIGGRVPEAMFVLDVDPRNGGQESLDNLEKKYGPLPDTLTTLSGRGDGGVHLFYRRPKGKLSSRRLGEGIDVKTSSGYVVLPTSVHPDTGRRYTRIEREVAATPGWLADLLRAEARAASQPRLRIALSSNGPGIADRFSDGTSWSEVLEPHGWRCVTGDPETDGARWRHPNATSPSSASVMHGKLFVYSPNTSFETTEAGGPNGYTKFRAYALLNHNGDMSVASRALRKED